MRDALASALLAAQFLTRLPLPARGYTPARWARAPGYFALAGLGLGLGLAGLFWAMAQVWPQSVAAVLTLGAGLILTGALHEDGLADCLDGLGGGRDRDRALEIMRDSQIGSYGALGLGIVLGTQAVALATTPLVTAIGALVIGHTLGRALMAQALGQGRYLRAKGAGTGMDEPLGRTGWATTGLAVALSALLALLVLGVAGTASAIAGGVVAGAVWRRWTRHRLGGDTGDTLGALHCVALTGSFLGATAWA
ncbi:MAG: adenosylcobinamide-GDP ribazoletransferase [Alphaproteobacteria bacterium]|jgi:adenosylcobinamide-GDP ribazoletransferase|nr:adenosylcobinamide-GDP ribazoletransferase [Alphaproteobacteria bacterium]